MSGARFKLRNVTQDGEWSLFDDAGFEAEPGDVIEAQLEDTPALDIWQTIYTCEDRSDGRTAPTFDPVSGEAATPTSAVSFTLPVERGTWSIQCQTNGGASVPDAGGRPDFTVHTKIRYVAVRTENLALRHPLAAETTQFSPRGIASALQEMIDAVDEGGAAGAAGVNAFTTTTQEYIQPNPNEEQFLEVVEASWMAVGQPLIISDGTNVAYARVVSVAGDVVTVDASDFVNNPATGTTIAIGAKVSPAGEPAASTVLVDTTTRDTNFSASLGASYKVDLTSNVTATLPAASNANRDRCIEFLQVAGAGDLILTPASGQIEGLASFTFNGATIASPDVPGIAITVKSLGAGSPGWKVVARG